MVHRLVRLASLVSAATLVACAAPPTERAAPTPTPQQRPAAPSPQPGQNTATTAVAPRAPEQPAPSTHPFVQGAQEIRVTPRVFGVRDCQLRTTAVYRTQGHIVVAFQPAPCPYFKLLPQINLLTPKGNLRMTEISLATEKDKQWPYPPLVRPAPGQTFFMRFKTDIPHSDAEAAASGINRDLCISWDCLNDNEGQRQAKAYSVNVAATQAVQAAGNHGAVKHRLLSLEPLSINSHRAEGGSLNALDMYYFGLSTLAKTQPTAKSKFLQYLSSTIDYEQVGVADNPFDKQDYAASLPKERAAFVDRMFAQQGSAPPKSLVLFGYASLDNYDMATETMSFKSCRDHGSMQHGMYCGNSGLLLGSLQPINDRAFQLAQEGSLVSRGKAKPRQFGQYNQRGPIYALASHGIPQNYTAKVPKDVARALFEMAKGSPLPRHARDQGFGNKTVGLKILLEDFAPVGLNNGSVTYASKTSAFCLFDYTGARAVYCADFPRQRN